MSQVAIESRGPQAAIGMKVEGGLQFSVRLRSCPASRRSNRRARNGGASSSRGGHCDLLRLRRRARTPALPAWVLLNHARSAGMTMQGGSIIFRAIPAPLPAREDDSWLEWMWFDASCAAALLRWRWWL
jgi:hypothetical protein